MEFFENITRDYSLTFILLTQIIHSLTHTHTHTHNTQHTTHKGTFRTDTLPAPGEKATTSHQLVSYGRNDESPPKSIVPFLSGTHLLLAWKDRLELVRVEDGQVIETSSLQEFGGSLDGIGQLVSVYRQKHKSAIQHLWFCTDRRIVRVLVRPVSSRGNNVTEPWRVLLCHAKHLEKLSDFAYTKAENIAYDDNDISGYFAVRSARAWHHLREGNMNVAATLFATCAGERLGTPFETFSIPYCRVSSSRSSNNNTTTHTLYISRESFLTGIQCKDDLTIRSASSESQRLYDFAVGQKILAVNNNPVATLDMLNRELENMEYGDDEDNILCILISSAQPLTQSNTQKESLARMLEMSLRRVISHSDTNTSTRQKTILALWLLEVRLSLVMTTSSERCQRQHLLDVVMEYCEEMDSRAAVSMLSSSIICRVAASSGEDDEVLETLLKCVFVISDMSEDHCSRVVSLLLALRLPKQLSEWFLEMMRAEETSERRLSLENLVYVAHEAVYLLLVLTHISFTLQINIT